MHARSLTRRKLLGALGAGALALASASFVSNTPAAPRQDVEAGRPDLPPEDPPPDPPADQSAGPSPEPTLAVPLAGPMRIGPLDGGHEATRAAQQLYASLARAFPGRAFEYGPAGQGIGAAPQVAVGAGEPGADRPRLRLTRHLVPVTNWRLPVRYLEPQELADLLAGRLTNWAQVSPVSAPIERLAFAPTEGAQPGIVPAARYDSYDALVAGLNEHPFGYALVPLDLIDFRVQALAVGDLDPLAGRGDPAAYPLKATLWLSWDPGLDPAIVGALPALAAEQGYAADGGPPPGTPINVTIAGDIIFGRTVHSRMVGYGDWAYPLRGVAPRLAAADLTIADLECSLSDNTEKPADPFTYLFTTNSAAVTGLDLAGIDGVSLANNHSMNFGRLGLTDTLTVLAQHGITPFGAGLDLAQARRPGIFQVKGSTIAFLGYDGISAYEYGARADRSGTSPLDTALLLEDLARARAAGATIVIPFFHWSEEYVAVPSREMRRVAHLAIDHGATMVVGSHPHWVQGTEWYKGAPILYSLGNFVFDQNWSPETMQGMFAELVFRDNRPVRVRLVPVLIEDMSQPRILGLAEGLPVLQRVYDATDVIKAM